MADKIDIVVGASDRASAILRGINDQTAMLADTLDRTDQSAKSVTISMGGVTAAAGLLAAAYASLQISESVASFLSKSSEEFVELEKAARKLDPALRDLARSMEVGTNTDEKSILGVMKQAQRQGFATDQIDDAAQAALGLSEAMGISLADGLTKARQAAEGNFDAFAYLIPGIDQLATSEEKLAAVSRLATQGLEDKAKAANNATSVFDRMNVQLGNLYDTVGKIIEPFRQLAYQGIATVAEMLSQSLEPAIDDFEKKFSNMGDTVSMVSKWITETIVGAFTLAEVTVEQFGTVMEGFGAALLLPLEQARSGWEYFFLDLVPALAKWLSKNVWNIFYDLGEAIIKVFTNLGTSIGEIMAGIWNYIANGFSADSYEQLMFEVGRAGTRGFMDGFEPVTEAFVVPPVRISEFEKTLRSMSDWAATSILSSFSSKFQERMAAIKDGFGKPFSTDINIKPKGSLSGMSSEVKVLQATESRLLTRGATDDPLVKISERQLQVLQDLYNASIRREDRNTQIILEGVS